MLGDYSYEDEYAVFYGKGKKCPYCNEHFSLKGADKICSYTDLSDNKGYNIWMHIDNICPNVECGQLMMWLHKLAAFESESDEGGFIRELPYKYRYRLNEEIRLYPKNPGKVDVPKDTPSIIEQKFAEAKACKEISLDGSGMVARKVLELILDDQYNHLSEYPENKPGGYKIEFAKRQDLILVSYDLLVDCIKIINKYGNMITHTNNFSEEDVDTLIECNRFLIDYFYNVKIKLDNKANAI